MQAAEVRKNGYVPEPDVKYQPDLHKSCSVYAGTMVQQVPSPSACSACLVCSPFWAARNNTWFLIESMPKGVNYSFLFCARLPIDHPDASTQEHNCLLHAFYTKMHAQAAQL